MAILVKTENPKELLTSILELIENDKIRTWKEYDHKTDVFARYFTYKTASRQYNRKAVFKTIIKEDGLLFRLIFFKGVPKDIAISGIYHGRFTQTLLSHFPNEIQAVGITMK